MTERYVLKSKCQICRKMCILEKVWKHKEEKGHPPYPKLEWTREEALADYRKFKEANADLGNIDG